MPTLNDVGMVYPRFERTEINAVISACCESLKVQAKLGAK